MNYNQLIDHTLLAPDASKEQITNLVLEAKEYNFKSVCINPGFVSYCHELLKDSDVKVCTVIGFPLGATTTNTKAIETLEALNNGADEIDMVINISKLKDKEYDYVKKEIALLKSICKDHILKVIIETCLLTDDEKVIACQLAKEANADFVKTSTGFSKGGATVHDIDLMRKTVGPEMGVKASGGVKTKEDMMAMVENGATRIGTSHGIDLVK